MVVYDHELKGYKICLWQLLGFFSQEEGYADAIFRIEEDLTFRLELTLFDTKYREGKLV